MEDFFLEQIGDMQESMEAFLDEDEKEAMKEFLDRIKQDLFASMGE